jgi:hypothetical protein
MSAGTTVTHARRNNTVNGPTRPVLIAHFVKISPTPQHNPASTAKMIARIVTPVIVRKG